MSFTQRRIKVFSGAGSLGLLLLLGFVAHSAIAAGAKAPPAAPQWLKINSAASSVKLTLIAGYQGVNGEYNFDGYAYGKMIVTIPVGWTVHVFCSTDASAQVSHSCVVTKKLTSTRPAFPHAEIPNPIDGVAPGATAKFTFIATKPGKYRINCLVTGHEVAGMWDTLRVVATGAPSIAFK